MPEGAYGELPEGIMQAGMYIQVSRVRMGNQGGMPMEFEPTPELGAVMVPGRCAMGTPGYLIVEFNRFRRG